MPVIKNNHDAPLGLPGGPIINPGRSVRVDDFARMRDNVVVKGWLDAGAIEELADEAPKKTPATTVTPTSGPETGGNAGEQTGAPSTEQTGGEGSGQSGEGGSAATAPAATPPATTPAKPSRSKAKKS